MYKVLPSMRRLAAEILDAYGFTVTACVKESEYALGGSVQCPFLIYRLAPNRGGFRYLSIRSFNGPFSKSYNNGYAVLIPEDEAKPFEIAPSWRGHLVPWTDLGKEKYRYYIGAGYMPMHAPRDFREEQIIAEWLQKQREAVQA